MLKLEKKMCSSMNLCDQMFKKRSDVSYDINMNRICVFLLLIFRCIFSKSVCWLFSYELYREKTTMAGCASDLP